MKFCFRKKMEGDAKRSEPLVYKCIYTLLENQYLHDYLAY